MEFIVDIFYAFLFILGGMAIIKYRRNLKGWTGNWFWAERYLGSGGTYLVMIIIGLAMIFFGVLYPFGAGDFLGGV